MASSFVFLHKVFMAPMAGITDQPTRRIIHEVTKGQVSLVSEMVSVNAISFKNAKTYRIADVRAEPYPVTIQLMGGDPALFSDAAKLVTDLGAAGIDINMGCPVRKVLAADAGALLMTDPVRAAKIIKHTKNATHLPVSVKFRKGFDNAHINAVSFAKMCEDCGASYITIHGRTKAQGYSGQADWDIIREVKENIKIPLIGNGDITSAQSAQQMLDITKADAVMVGRAALGNPWLLSEIADALDGKPLAPMKKNVYDVLMRHLGYLKEYYGPKVALGLSRKYVCWYSKSCFDAKKLREAYMKITDFDKATEILQDYFKHQGDQA